MQFPSQKLLLLLTPRLPHCITSAVREDVAADVKLLAIVLVVGRDLGTRGVMGEFASAPCYVKHVYARGIAGRHSPSREKVSVN
jgi:hypothetical protein